MSEFIELAGLCSELLSDLRTFAVRCGRCKEGGDNGIMNVMYIQHANISQRSEASQ